MQSKYLAIIATVIAVLITPNIGQTDNISYAEQQYDAEYIAKVFNEIDPFIVIDEKTKLLTFDMKAAYNAGISKEYIDVGKEFVDMQNEVITIVKEDHIKSNKIESNKIKKFEKFFESIAEGNNQAQESGAVCGGSQNNPHPCPPWNNSGIYRNSRTAIVNYLLSIGFHQTAWYASYGNDDDFTKGCDAYGCSSPIFRTQAIIFQSGSSWSYRTQTPEPNPEIFSYTWPVWWWGSYVQWWHNNYC